MHANDYRKAAGGFIHGFRYLVRSLHRVLEIEEETITPHVHTLSSRDSNVRARTLAIPRECVRQLMLELIFAANVTQAHIPTEMPSTAQWPISLVSSALVARQGAPDDAAARNTCHELSKTTETQFGTPGCPLGDENPIVTSIPKPWVNSVASALNQVVTAVVTYVEYGSFVVVAIVPTSKYILPTAGNFSFEPTMALEFTKCLDSLAMSSFSRRSMLRQVEPVRASRPNFASSLRISKKSQCRPTSHLF